MGKIRFKSVRLFLKLLIFLQIYSHLKFKAEARENSFILKDNDGETGSKDGIFENEIEGKLFKRQKRPARLLPLKMIL